MRIYWVDFLRLVSAIAVITIHSATNFYATLDPSTGEWWFSNFLMTIAKSAGTAIFVMIAGFVLLSKDIEYTGFYKSRAKRILIPLFFWSVFYSIFIWIFIDESFQNLIWRLTFGFFLSGKTYFHLWYLSMFIWLVLFTPLLSKIVQGKHISTRDIKILFVISCAFFLMSSLSNIKQEISGEKISWFTSFGLYIIYFIMGHLIPKHLNSIEMQKKYLLSIYLLILMGGILMNYIMASKGFRNDNIIFGNNTIFGFLAAVLFFTYIAKAKPGESISTELYTLAQSSFGVYLIHPLILFFVSSVTVKISLEPYSAVLLNIAATATLSFCIIHCLRKTRLGRSLT